MPIISGEFPLFEIVSKEVLGPAVFRLRILAPEVARKHQAGNFIMLRIHENGERIPLTVADKDVDARHRDDGLPGDGQDHHRAGSDGGGG